MRKREAHRLLCVITNKDLIRLDYMPRKTAKGSQLFTKANQCISERTALEFRQNGASMSIIVNFSEELQTTAREFGYFCRCTPRFDLAGFWSLVQTRNRRVPAALPRISQVQSFGITSPRPLSRSLPRASIQSRLLERGFHLNPPLG